MNFHGQVVLVVHEYCSIICEYHYQVHPVLDQDLLNARKFLEHCKIILNVFHLHADDVDVSPAIEPLGVLIHRT